eukprot:EG_transcript_6000
MVASTVVAEEPSPKAAAYRALWDQIRRGQYTDCLEASAAMLERNPQDPQVFCIQAHARRLKGELDECIGLCQQALEIDPQCTGAYMARAQAMQQKADYAACIDDFARAISLCTDPAAVGGPAGQGGQGFLACIQDATAAIAQDPTDPFGYLIRAVAYRTTGKLDEAVADLTEVLALQPNDAFALQQRAHCQLLRGCPLDCIADCALSLARGRDTDGTTHLLRAKAFLALGNAEHAIRDCTAAVTRKPSNLGALLIRAQAYQQLKEWDCCAEDCAAVLNLQPDNVHALELRVEASMQLKEYTQCIEDCNVALKLDPDGASTPRLYAIRAEAKRRRDNAYGCIEDSYVALTLDPMMLQPYLSLSAAYISNGQFPLAMAECTKGLHHHPANAELLVFRARCHLELKQWLQCIRDCTDVISAQVAGRGVAEEGWLTPMEVRATAYATRAAAFLAQLNSARCIDDCNKALKCDPELVVAYTCRAQARRADGDTAGCIEDCTAALKLDCGDFVAYQLRAETYAQTGEYRKVVEDCSEAILLHPGDGAMYALRGAAKRLLKEYEDCVQDCCEAVVRDPECAMAYANRAAAQRHLGNRAAALEDAKQAVRLQPKYQFARQELEKLRLRPMQCVCFAPFLRLKKTMYSEF